MKGPVLTKLLQAQERGIKGDADGQRGSYIYIPKSAIASGVLPQLGTTKKNPSTKLNVKSRKTGVSYIWSLIYHNDKYFKGTRNEYRLYTRNVHDDDDRKSLLPGNEFRLYNVGKSKFEFDSSSTYKTSPVTQLVAMGTITKKEFDPHGLIDERTFREVVRAIRSGQPNFRKKLLKAYGRKCAVTGADVEQCLEAAHIAGYSGPRSNDIGNGILLRADLHCLFDAGLIGFNPKTKAVTIASKIRGTVTAAALKGAKLVQGAHASRIALKAHLKQHGLPVR